MSLYTEPTVVCVLASMLFDASFLALAALPTVAGTFAALFAYDVYRSRTAMSQPKRMLSELVFNAVMSGCMILMACGVAAGVLRWLESLITSGWTNVLTAVCMVAAAATALRRAAMYAAELPATPIPDFMRCDGEFVATPGDPHPMCSWCGWLRFEGHGACRVRASVEARTALTCEWHVHAADTLRVVVPPAARSPHTPAEFFVRGAEVDLMDATLTDTILVSVDVDSDATPALRMSFVAEEATHDEVHHS